MTKTDKALERLQELSCDGSVYVTISEFEGKPFAIVDGWNDVQAIGTLLHPLLEDVGPPEGDYDDGVLDALFDDNWGFSDKYTTCGECYGVIRTNPTHYGWTPDYWQSECDITCGDCVRSDYADEYIEWLVEQAAEGVAVGCHLLNPSDYAFSVVAEQLENGLHHGQADDPRTIAAWGNESGLQIVFSVRPSQFDISFDVWARNAEDADSGCQAQVLSANQLRRVKETLFVDAEDKYPQLRQEFRQCPTPAQRMEEGLKNPVVHTVSAEDFIAGKALDHGLDAAVVSIVIE